MWLSYKVCKDFVKIIIGGGNIFIGGGGLHLTWQTGRVGIRHNILATILALHALDTVALPSLPESC